LAYIRHNSPQPGSASGLDGKRDLDEGELPALGSFVPDVGEACFLFEGLAVVGAGKADPAGENDRRAEVVEEGRLDDVGVCVAARDAYQLDESGLIRDAAACANEDIIVGDQPFEFCSVALSFWAQS
jgi:hypothetical protein